MQSVQFKQKIIFRNFGKILIIKTKSISISKFFKDNKFNRGCLDMVAHRDKEGRLRLGLPDEITPESITPIEIPF